MRTMKTFLGFVTLCLAVFRIDAASAPPLAENYGALLQEIHSAAKQLEDYKEHLLQRLYEPLPTAWMEQVNDVLAVTRELQNNNNSCVESAAQKIDTILDHMLDSRAVCMANMRKSVEDIILDIDLIVSEILLDAYELTLVFKQCEAEKEKVLRGLCFSRFSIKILICINDLGLTINNITQSSGQCFDEVTTAAGNCNQSAVDKAVQLLHAVYNKINKCRASF